MSVIVFLSDFFEMIAALSALLITFLMYREVRRNQQQDERDDKD